MRKSIEERFWEKVDIKSPEECWNWKGAKRNDYGMFWLNGSASTAHRIAYFIENGKIPEGMDILHRGTIYNIWNTDRYICKEGFYV